MEQLRPVELRLVEELFGMGSGYVLDFTDATFADFFRREVGIDIYDQAYAINGGSKGKHLRTFLMIGQPRAIGRALAALWEYREAGRLARGEAETVINARGRLSAIVERLGSGALLNYDPPPETTKASSAPSAPATDETKLRELEGRFLELHQMGDEPQARGLFVSFSGFTDVGLQAFTARKIILADGMDIYDALARRLSIPEIIAAKIRHASEQKQPFARVRALFPL